MNIVQITHPTAGRLYLSPNGLLLPGINKALAMVAKPALGPGMAKSQREHTLKAVALEYPKSLAAGVKDGAEFRKRVEAASKELASVVKARDSKNIGEQTKMAINWWLTNNTNSADRKLSMPDIEPGAMLSFFGFEDFCKAHNASPYRVEEPIYNEGDGYFAQVTSVLTKGGLATLDVTTGKAIYDEQLIRSAAHFHAMKQAKFPVKMAIVLRLPKSLDEPDFEARVLTAEELDKNLKLFFAHMGVWSITTGYATPIRAVDAHVAEKHLEAAHG